MKRGTHVILLMLCMALCAALVPCLPAGAEADGAGHAHICVDDGLDSETCFEGYIGGLFGLTPPRRMLRAGRAAGDGLTGDVKLFYDALKPRICEVADGTATSTVFTVEIGYTLEGGQLYQLLSALLSDCPYELYWFDKTRGIRISYSDASTTFYFIVNDEYSAGEYEVDPTAVNAAKAAVERAEAIVAGYADAPDYDKLEGYRQEICALASYNYDPAGETGRTYGNAWQLVWVFDGDESTNVVCEGYSKAFQYLCERTEFGGGVECCIVTGRMGGGLHMWNLVKMENGKVYLADITNSDSGTMGEDGLLFLAGYDSGSVEEGYVFRCGEAAATYTYDEDTRALFPAERLAVSAFAYLNEPVAVSDWLIRIEGDTCSVAGYTGPGGEVEIPADIGGYGVVAIGAKAFRDMPGITGVTIPEGVAEIGDRAFSGCAAVAGDGDSGLRWIIIPDGVQHMGEGVFDGCDEGLAFYCTEASCAADWLRRHGYENITEWREPEYHWSEDCGAVEAVRAHRLYPDRIAPQTETAVAIYEVTRSPTQQDRGACTYTAVFENPAFLPQTMTVEDIPALGEMALLELPAGLTRIDEEAFANLACQAALIPEGCESIGARAFEGCAELLYVRIPSGVAEIAEDAFAGCDRVRIDR